MPLSKALLSFILCLGGFLSIHCQTVDITSTALRDKINGGIIGQFFGNLNGLVHENEYFEEPGNVETYVPDLSDGAFTDDDTDIEFVYIHHMLESGQVTLPYDEVNSLWVNSINDHIWCSNRYARNLMDIGMAPPYTGRIAFNPWAVFNISGQFLCEEFALIAPGMPQTASRIGAHYTHVAIDGEPTQTTQLYDAMIATAFFEDDPMKIIEAGLAAVDGKSEIHSIVSNVKKWYLAHPDDWRKTRAQIKEHYWEGTWGNPGGSNGYRTITAATIGSLLHGRGDFVEAIRLAFNFGWDADNISSMVGTIMGVLKGEKWIRAQGWDIKDEYRNTRRPGLPEDLTITDFANLHFALAQKLILENGGEKIKINGEEGFRIVLEEPRIIEPLPNPLHRAEELREQWWPIIQEDLSGNHPRQARAVYVAICLELVDQVAPQRRADWYRALGAFAPHYEALFGDDQWDSAAKRYFNEVVNNKNIYPDYPFGYGAFESDN